MGRGEGEERRLKKQEIRKKKNKIKNIRKIQANQVRTQDAEDPAHEETCEGSAYLAQLLAQRLHK